MSLSSDGMDESDSTEEKASAARGRGMRPFLFSLVGITLIAGGLVALAFATLPPAAFPRGERIEIPFGTSIAEAAQTIGEKNAVRSSIFLRLILIAEAGESGIKAGVYRFDEPISVFAVAHALLYGTHSAPLARITIPEGLQSGEIGVIVAGELAGVAPDAFENAARGKEGYLFPDTYHVPDTFTAAELVALMERTFVEKVAPLFATSTRTKEEIITMASILEREANDEESLGIVSGILWKRFDQGMPLQVDASFSYLLHKESKDVTEEDFKIDSPYNTYTYKGLPPTPINNPGLAAIKAALAPLDSPYLYYLTAPDGTFHYAKTFEEHKKNKARYLN
jgi:UPF0755 protein